MKTSIALGLIVCSLFASQGCSLFHSGCSKALTVLVASQSYAHEAQVALDDARRAIDSSGISDAAKAKAGKAIDAAQLGLQAASKTLAAASSACSRPDPVAVFGSFVSAWSVVREFLSLVGDGGVQAVADPTIYTMSK